MKNLNNKQNPVNSIFISLSILGCSLVTFSSLAADLNYESISSLEEPLAFEYQDVTFSLTGLLDSGGIYSEQNDSSDTTYLGNIQLSAETQLSNSWTLGGAYFAEYDESNENDEFTDNVAVYVGGIWGIGSVGNVTGLVRETTRRLRGTGNADLFFDDNLGALDDYGVTYIGRFGPSQFLATADQDGNYEIASTFQRPIGNKDYRFSLRFSDSEYTPDNEITTFDSLALKFVSELTYGSNVFDLGLGLEQLSTNSISYDRRYLSFGASRKIGRLTFSGEAHFGDIEGASETSYALGANVEIARGLSLNLGLNHRDAMIDLDTISLVNEDDTEASLSLRYSF